MEFNINFKKDLYFGLGFVFYWGKIGSIVYFSFDILIPFLLIKLSINKTEGKNG